MKRELDAFDLSEVRFVKRVTVGSRDPNKVFDEDACERRMALVNRCLSDYPKGILISKEIAFGIYHIGEHQVSLQSVTYHIGFKRKPDWME